MEGADLEDPWEKAIITCDGGGIRGYATLIMIFELMRHIGIIERSLDTKHTSSFAPHRIPPELIEMQNGIYGNHDQGSYARNYFPCHYFDYIFGTSTGSLIAIMLSRWRMDVAECRRRFETLGGEVFGSPRWFHFHGVPRNKHCKRRLVGAIEAIRREKTPIDATENDHFELFPAPDDLCRTCVLALQKGTLVRDETRRMRVQDGVFLFRTYNPVPAHKNSVDLPQNLSADINKRIKSIARATTAAPQYFAPEKLDTEEYMDAGVGYNNPTLEAMDEIRRLHHQQGTQIIASFGTGLRADIHWFDSTTGRLNIGFKHLLQLMWNAVAAVTDSEHIHREATGRVLSMSPANPIKYFRFNPAGGIGDVELDEWKNSRDDGHGGRCHTLEYIESITREQINKEEFQTNMEALARILVNKRRRRAQNNPDRWERFACCTYYRCTEIGCGLEEKLRGDMRTHLRGAHSSPDGTIEDTLDQCRHEPTFAAGPF